MVAVSLSTFAIRAVASLAGGLWVKNAPVRLFVHSVDAVLLASALGMLFIWQPAWEPAQWVAAKVVGLVAYIWLASRVFKASQTLGKRLTELVGCLLVLSWMISVAIIKSPMGYFSLL